jgi:hypothetical protein
MSDWASQELAALDVGDRRRTARAQHMVGAMAELPGGSVPQVFKTHAEVKAAYRFLSCEQVTPQALGAALREACVARIAEHSVVLAIQDTTTLNYTHHPGTAGRGPLAEPHVLGFLVHSVLAVSGQGVPLGVLHQKQWARDPDAPPTHRQRHRRPFADKESVRWVESLQVVHEHIPAETTLINVADREGDIYEVFAQPRPRNSELLIRSCYNRCLDKSDKQLHETLEAQPVAGEMNARLRLRPDRKPKDVCLQVRYCTVTLQPPAYRVEGTALAPVTLRAILVTEKRRPKDRKPVRWLLLTTLAVESLEDVRRIVTYYTYRWLIERFHYTLKSGCRMEQSQLRSVARLRRLLALYCIVAWRLLWMLYLSRAEPDCSCLVALTDQEWRLLYLAWQHLHHRDDPLPTQPPPPLAEAARRIAQLGGFIGRKGDGDPGVQTLWRGLTRLQDIVLGATLDNAARHAQDVGNA